MTLPERQDAVRTESADDVDVGQRLRLVRQSTKATLRDVATRAGVSDSFLSQLERGRVSCSIATLKRIATVLGVSMADLFEPTFPLRTRPLRRSERPCLAFGHLGKKYLLTPRPLEHLEVLVGEFEPGGTTGDAYSFGDSEELFVVLKGRVQLEVDGEIFSLADGDSMTYRSSMQHRAANVADEPAEVLWVISPPSY